LGVCTSAGEDCVGPLRRETEGREFGGEKSPLPGEKGMKRGEPGKKKWRRGGI